MSGNIAGYFNYSVRRRIDKFLVVSYGVIDHIESVFPITAGNLMIAMTAIPGKFCISFQQVVRNDKYLKHFLDILDEENIGYSVGEMEEKKLPLDPVI